MKDYDTLKNYLPDKSVNQVMKWIVQKKVHLKITRKRRCKLGDYRPPITYPNHRISINYNLNQFSFLITFVHEMAHLNVWESYKNTVAPHGIEWKTEYKKLMKVMLKKDIFPDDIKQVLGQSILNSKASTSSEIQLLRILKNYDEYSFGIHLEDIAEGLLFQTENGAQFRKGKKRRIRYLCKNIRNKKDYLFHPLTSVLEVNE